jgi:hypothetical protein
VAGLFSAICVGRFALQTLTYDDLSSSLMASDILDHRNLDRDYSAAEM